PRTSETAGLTISIRQGEILVRSSRRSEVSKRIPPVGAAAAPLIKWAGGKQWLARAAHVLAPRGWDGMYFEPFVGAGAFFFALNPRSAVLGDTNTELIETYRTVRRNPVAVIHVLRSHPYNEDFYYKLRGSHSSDAVS